MTVASKYRDPSTPLGGATLGRLLKLMGGLGLLSMGLFLAGCGGSYGVEQGTITGRVFGNATGGSSVPTGLSGVQVRAVRTEGVPLVFRAATTDENGDYVLTNLPTGLYNLTFGKQGWRNIPLSTADDGTGPDATPPGGIPITAFVEPGSTYPSADVILEKTPERGDATLVVNLVDDATGTAITHATITVGTASTSNGGANGRYTLSVPVSFSDVNALEPVGINIIAEGYDAVGGNTNPQTISLAANETHEVTFRMRPHFAIIQGTIRISQFETLLNLGPFNIRADGFPADFFTGNVNSSPAAPTVVNPTAPDGDGSFTIVVPASNVALTRQFNLIITRNGFQTTVVSNVVAPTSYGVRVLSSPVVVEPITVDLVGTVVDSNGNAPNQLNPQGVPDIVTVVETGQVGNIINGSYTIPGVPAIPARPWTLQASGFNPLATNGGGTLGAQQVGMQTVTPTSDGSANPTFTVPLIPLG